MFLLLYIMYQLKLLRNNALFLSEPDMTSSSSVPTQQEYLEIEATAAHPDDPSKRHICIHPHPKDMVGLEIEATAAHPDDHSKRHYCIPTYPKDMEGPEIEATAAHPDDHS